MTIRHLVTHSGGFHADELLSSVILTRLFPDATLLRTLDPAWTTPDATRLVYDVGRHYDPDLGIFDHHQRPGPLRSDGAPYSSFGLVWHHYGHAYLAALDVPDAHADRIHCALDGAFVRPVDLLDNGALEPGAAGPLSKLTLPVLLESLKPTFDARSPEAEDRAFAQALSVARTLFEAAIAAEAARVRAEALVGDAIARAGSAPILELPVGMPFRAAIEAAGADHLLFVVHPRDGDWAVNTIRKAADTFAARADLPDAWAGLTDEALETATGVRGARFCHSGRFLAIAQTRDAAFALAERAVAAHRARGAE